MAQPVEYTPSSDFSDLGSVSPEKLDRELGDISLTIEQIRINLAYLQRDDTRLVNGSVHPQAIAANTLKMLGLQGSWTLRGDYTVGVDYALGDVFTQGTPKTPYLVTQAFTASNFATDAAFYVSLSGADSVLAQINDIIVQASVTNDGYAGGWQTVINYYASISTAVPEGIYVIGSDGLPYKLKVGGDSSQDPVSNNGVDWELVGTKIDDAATAATSTWSSTKINTDINQYPRLRTSENISLQTVGVIAATAESNITLTQDRAITPNASLLVGVSGAIQIASASDYAERNAVIQYSFDSINWNNLPTVVFNRVQTPGATSVDIYSNYAVSTWLSAGSNTRIYFRVRALASGTPTATTIQALQNQTVALSQFL